MLVNNRLDRVQGSAKQVIASTINGSYLGIVSFGGYAQINHLIVQIKGKIERYSLISSIPSNTTPYTCLKEGLETSKDVLKQSIGNDKLCSLIILITDGEDNCTKTASDAIPELFKAGIRINSVGLGSSASNELENELVLVFSRTCYIFNKLLCFLRCAL
jgi:Mg-chelatase subunit ChlD